jgi:hypothetical protein
MNLSDLADITGLNWGTAKGIVAQRLERDYAHPRLKDLKYLSLDEIYVGRQKKFYTLVIDLESGRIVWVGKGKGGSALTKFWRALRLSKARIQAVAMDMSAAYWAAVLENLREAAIVFDRFHITKLVNEKLDDVAPGLWLPRRTILHPAPAWTPRVQVQAHRCLISICSDTNIHDEPEIRGRRSLLLGNRTLNAER